MWAWALWWKPQDERHTNSRERRPGTHPSKLENGPWTKNNEDVFRIEDGDIPACHVSLQRGYIHVYSAFYCSAPVCFWNDAESLFFKDLFLVGWSTRRWDSTEALKHSETSRAFLIYSFGCINLWEQLTSHLNMVRLEVYITAYLIRSILFHFQSWQAAHVPTIWMSRWAWSVKAWEITGEIYDGNLHI